MKRAPDNLPRPPVDPEVDLRGLAYMPLFGGHLYGSQFELECSDAELRAALRLWWGAWNQVPAASLPASERAQARLAGFEDELSERWQQVKGRALHGFKLCSDGRLYHEFLGYQASIAWDKRATNVKKREGNSRRKEREREERKALFAALREMGLRPGWKTATNTLRELVSAHKRDAGSAGSGGSADTSGAPVTPPVTLDVTNKTGRDGNIRGSAPGEASAGNSRAGAHAPAPAPVAPPVPPQPEEVREEARRAPTPAGEVGLALKRSGLNPMQFNLADPVFLALLEQGATVEEFEGIARDAIGRKISRPFPWILKTLEGRRADARALALAAPRGDHPKKSTALEQQADNIAGLTGGKRRNHHDDNTIDVTARRVD